MLKSLSSPLVGAVVLALLSGCSNSSSGASGGATATGTAPASGAATTAPATTTSAQVVVVGGGLAGLVAAYELEKKGVRVEVLEATDTWGGRVATAYYGSDQVYGEYGMQEMWASNPLLRVARELKVDLDEKVEEPYSSVVIDGKLYPFVQDTSDKYFLSFLSPAEKKALDGWMGKAKALRQTLEAQGADAPAVEALKNESFAEWVATFKLPSKVENWIRLTIECELATDWKSFSGAIGLAEFGFFLGGGEHNYTVRGGNGRLIRALVAAIKGPKHLSSTVIGIDHGPAGKPGRPRVSYLVDQRLHTIEADRVIVAVPFWRLHQIRFDPPLSSEKWQGIFTLNRGQYTVVHLLIDKAARKLWKVGDQSPFPVLSDGTLGVIYGVIRQSPDPEPFEVFSLLIHGVAAGSFHMIPREIKLKEINEALDKLWPGLSSHIHESYVYTYHPASIPVWPAGRSPADAEGKKLTQPEGGVYLVGDYTVSGHSNGAAESGIAAAERIAKELAR
jgi:monoamine oxidase